MRDCDREKGLLDGSPTIPTSWETTDDVTVIETRKRKAGLNIIFLKIF